MNLQDKIIGMIGIARRGKYTYIGQDIIFKIKKGKIRLIIMAQDAPKSVQDELENLALEHNATTIVFLSKKELGSILNLNELNAIGIANSSIARKIESLQQEVENYGKEN